MSSRRTSSVPKEEVVFLRMLYCDSRCSQTLTGLSLVLPGALLRNATHRLSDRQHLILRQRVRVSVRAVRAVRNTRLFQTETRVVADDVLKYIPEYDLKYASNSTESHILSLLDSMLPGKLSRSIRVYSKYVARYTSNDILNYTSEHGLNNAPNCT